MTEQTTTATVPTLVRGLSSKLAEPDWLLAAREGAWQQFEAMTSGRLEKTDLTRRSYTVGELPAQPGGTVPAGAQSLLDGLESPVVSVVDGAVTKTVLPAALSDQGVVFTDLHTALQQHPELVRKHLGSVVKSDESKWVAQNAALWHGGVFLYVPSGVTIDEAFVYVSVQTEAGQGSFPRVLVVGGENSSFSFAQMHIAGDGAPSSPHSSVTEVIAGDAANVQVMSVNQLRKGPTNFLVERAKLGKDAVVNWVFGDVGDGFTVALVESVLAGVGSRSLTQVLGLGYGRQHMDLTASMVHRGRYSESDIRMQGVLRNRANSVFRSSTHIERGAVSAGSEQHDRMLLIDKTARADAIPMLLIDESDVERCGHAASIGKLNPDHIYYLMSRGVSRDEATRMMIWGYLKPIVDSISVPQIQTWLTDVIERKLTS